MQVSPVRAFLASLAITLVACSSGMAPYPGNGDAGPSPPFGCTSSSAACAGGAMSLSCGAGVDPAAIQTNLACTTPVAEDAGGASYCCFVWHGGLACLPDDALGGACATGGSYGFQCSGGQNPTAGEPFLSCGPAGIEGSATTYCCTLQ